jgi:nucleoside-diphosphate-sugar epimerase
MNRTSQAVVADDLEYIAASLRDEFSKMTGRNLLIAGGAGFLGHYLVQSALHFNKTRGQQPIHVTVLDNFIRGVPPWLTALNGDVNLELVKHDIAQPLPASARDYQFLVNAASIASPIYYRKYPVETMDSNINGLRYMLDYARDKMRQGKEVGGVLFFSSSEIYGDPNDENIPTPETYRGNVSCTGPRACYDEAKRYGETLCVNFAQQYGVPVRMARPFNNYGPGLKITDGRALPDFARNVMNGKDIVLLSDGAPRRTFCYVADAVIGYYKILVRGRAGEPYNIGVENPEISVFELAEKVVAMSGRLFGYKGRIVRQVSSDKDYLVDNPNRRCPIIDKARKELDYNPTVTLEDGLERSLLWYAGNREAEEA